MLEMQTSLRICRETPTTSKTDIIQRLAIGYMFYKKFDVQKTIKNGEIKNSAHKSGRRLITHP
jgi:hypothetical protein